MINLATAVGTRLRSIAPDFRADLLLLLLPFAISIFLGYAFIYVILRRTGSTPPVWNARADMDT